MERMPDRKHKRRLRDNLFVGVRKGTIHVSDLVNKVIMALAVFHDPCSSSKVPLMKATCQVW